MNPQIEGIEDLPGTYVFDLASAKKAMRLNRYFWELARPEKRELFRTDEEESYRQAGLTEEEAALVRNRDWLGYIQYGVIFFVLEKFARTLGESNLQVYAKMRSESFEDFMKTRRVPDAR